MANDLAPETPGRQEPPRQMFGNLIATTPLAWASRNKRGRLSRAIRLRSFS